MADTKAIDWLVPGGALHGPLFRSLAERIDAGDEPDLAPGTLVGPFRIVAVLGRGGMATVYLAERADGAYEQKVALKLLHPRLARVETGQVLLRRERQILAKLDHPAIAALLDGGTSADGRVWFAMQWVEGERIDRWCDARAATADARLALVRRVVDAVAHAHARGVVHRDIKPSNILVTADGDVKLLDFGIAALTEELDEGATQALTPGHASPEQLRGDAVTTASDVWQLGRLLAQLVLPAARRGARELAAIADRATRPEPSDRYDSASALAAELRAFAESRPVAARNGGAAYRTRLLLRRNRIAAVVALVALLALVATATDLTLRLVEQRDRALVEGARARAARKFMIEVFRVSDPGVNRGDTLTANEILVRGRERLATAYAEQPGLRAELLRTIAQVYSELGEFDLSRQLFDEAIAAADVAIDLTDAERSLILSDAAILRMRRGRYDEAAPMLERAAQLGAGLSGDDRPHQLLTLASVRRNLGDADGATRAYRDILAQVDESNDVRLRSRAWAQAFLCELAGDEHRDPATAVRWCAQSLATFARIRDPRGAQEAAHIAMPHAMFLAESGNAEEARRRWQRAYDSELKAFGDGHRRTRYALYVAARIEAAAGRPDAALAFLARAEAEPFPHEGRESLLADTAQLRGRLALARGDADEALRELERARTMMSARMAPGHWQFTRLDADRARALCGAGRGEEGRALLRDVVAAQAKYAHLAREREVNRTACD